MRAMVPSSLMISQITAAGMRPHIWAKSTPASVWPARTSTPPFWARRGKMWPGWTMSSGRAAGETAVWMVSARSAAEIPVEMPWAASMDTVKLVPYCAPLCWVMRGSLSLSTSSSAMGRHTRPRACLIMKLMASGVTNWAAMSRSPSFSRSSASVMMTILPALRSARISGMVEMGADMGRVFLCVGCGADAGELWSVSSHSAGMPALCSILRALRSPKGLFFNRAESSPWLMPVAETKSICRPWCRRSIHSRRLRRRSSVILMGLGMGYLKF